MSQDYLLERIDQKGLPLFYRVLLRVPVPAFMMSIVDRIPSGAFWVIAGAVWMADASMAVNAYLLLSFSFPLNVIMVCTLPVLPLLVVLRIALRRFIAWWNGIAVGGYTLRESRKVLEEYVALGKTKRTRGRCGLRRRLSRLLSAAAYLFQTPQVSRKR